MPGYTVVVVARSELFACGVKAAFEGSDIIVDVDMAGDTSLDESRAADALVLEWNVSSRREWESLHALRTAYPKTRLILSVLTKDVEELRRFVEQGADEVIHRSATSEQFRAAVRPDHPGLASPARTPAMAPPSAPSATRLDGLTARQADVVHLICSGLPNAEIADQLHLSINSVKSHIRGAYRTMGVRTRSEAVLWGLERGYGNRRPKTAPAARSASAVVARSRRGSEEAVDLETSLRGQAEASLAEADVSTICDSIIGMIEHPQYPCLGARSAVKRDAATIRVLDDMTGEASLTELADALATFAAIERAPRELATFIAVFRRPVPQDEREFERLLWGMLQRLHDADDAPWAEQVSSDPGSPHFGFSLGGVPFFLVGLHPAASRIARRAPLASVVFNLHDQFDRLRLDGTFERMRDAIRRRDTALQGSINPVVTDHGRSSEARQYSGRHVEDDWRAPFTAHPRRRTTDD